ncbi:MAG TPA: hypothetical protein VLK36_00305 [Gaiellaceae bacterium]|nr:hypothetical protein [Gaiellaceae bacterium]
MPRRLTEDDVKRIRALHVEGCRPSEIAATFDVSRRHVDRILAGERRSRLGDLEERPVADAVGSLLDRLELGERDQMRATMAMQLAAKLDQVIASDSAASAASWRRWRTRWRSCLMV